MKKYELPPLPYAYDGLEPHISKEIMTLHHDKHHLAYVNGANAALEKLENGRKNNFQGIDVKAIERDLSFHYAGHLLHSIFWANMKSGGGGKPGGAHLTKLMRILAAVMMDSRFNLQRLPRPWKVLGGVSLHSIHFQINY